MDNKDHINKRWEIMDIYSKPGTKVIYAYPENGWDDDKKWLKKFNLVVGQEYTVDYIEVDNSHSYVYLKEFPNQSFNTVNFSAASETQ